MNNRTWSYQIQLALLVGVVAAILILIVALVTREQRGLALLGASPGREPSSAPIDYVPPQLDSTRTQHILAQSRPTSEPAVEQSFDVNRAKIIEDVNVHLQRVEVTDQGLRVAYTMEFIEPKNTFFRPLFNRGDVTLLKLGKPNIRYSDGYTSVSTAYDSEKGSETIRFFDEPRTPVAGEIVTVSIASCIISAPEIAGSVIIPLLTRYGDFEIGQETKIETHLVIEDAQYGISLVKLGRIRQRIILTPINHAAKRTQLIFGEDRSEDKPGVRLEGASLTPASSNALNLYRKGTTFTDDLDRPLVKHMEFDFVGSVSPDVTSLTFSVQGGGRIIGPFIFENVHLVSE